VVALLSLLQFLPALKDGVSLPYLDEKRLRGRLQASAKEDIQNEINKWSVITGIPKSQFIKPVIKRHEGRRKSSGVIIRYSSAELRRKLIKEAKKFGFLSHYSSIG